MRPPFSKNFTRDDLFPAWKNHEGKTYPCPICNKKQHDIYLEDVIHRLKAENKCGFILVNGDFGSGKSRTSILLSRFIFPSLEQFDLDNVIYDFKDLLNFYKTKRNSCAVIEEVDTVFDYTLLWTPEYIEFRKIVRTQRVRNNFLFLNSQTEIPSFLKTPIKYRVLVSRNYNYVTCVTQKKRETPARDKWGWDLWWDDCWTDHIRDFTFTDWGYEFDDTTKTLIDAYEEKQRTWKAWALETNFGQDKIKPPPFISNGDIFFQ